MNAISEVDRETLHNITERLSRSRNSKEIGELLTELRDFHATLEITEAIEKHPPYVISHETETKIREVFRTENPTEMTVNIITDIVVNDQVFDGIDIPPGYLHRLILNTVIHYTSEDDIDQLFININLLVENYLRYKIPFVPKLVYDEIRCELHNFRAKLLQDMENAFIDSDYWHDQSILFQYRIVIKSRIIGLLERCDMRKYITPVLNFDPNTDVVALNMSDVDMSNELVITIQRWLLEINAKYIYQ